MHGTGGAWSIKEVTRKKILVFYLFKLYIIVDKKTIYNLIKFILNMFIRFLTIQLPGNKLNILGMIVISMLVDIVEQSKTELTVSTYTNFISTFQKLI